RPPREASEQPIGSLLADKPIEHGSCARYLRFYEIHVAAIPPEVAHHSNPQEREGRNDLRDGCGIAALGNPLRNSGIVKGLDRLASKPVITGNAIRDQGLDARVADVLQALPIRSIHIGVVRIEACGAPADLPDLT